MSPVSPVYIEQGARRCFACSLEWPGLCRAGKSEEAALAALDEYLPRYLPVARRARFGPRQAGEVRWSVVRRVPTRSGGADFGVPTCAVEEDESPCGPAERTRLIALLSASWDYFDGVVAGAPPDLRKGPRGGGRDRDAIAAHVAGGEQLYARKLGLKLPAPSDPATVAANRRAIADWYGQDAPAAEGSRARPDRTWPDRYAFRRLVWHVLDHAWEIEDRS